MILTAIYQMLSSGEQWNPSDLYKIDMPIALVENKWQRLVYQSSKKTPSKGSIISS